MKVMVWATALLLPLTMLTECEGGGDTPPEGQCHDWEDCENGMMCIPPGESPGCGMCFQPEQQCWEDTDCGSGHVCQSYEVHCSCGGPELLCVPRCTTNDQCGEGQVCDTTTGHCETFTCSMGKSCPELTTCVPGSGGDECMRWMCSGDDECGDGNRCVNGQCYDDYGYCSYPPARQEAPTYGAELR